MCFNWNALNFILTNLIVYKSVLFRVKVRADQATSLYIKRLCTVCITLIGMHLPPTPGIISMGLLAKPETITCLIISSNFRNCDEKETTSMANNLYGAKIQNAGTLPWRHNERDGDSNHQPHDCLLNRLFRGRSKKTSKLRVTGLCAGNSPLTGEFPAQIASNAVNVSIWWRHHV